MINKQIILERAKSEGLENVLQEIYLEGFNDSDKIEASLMIKRAQFMRKIFLEHRNLYLENNNTWFNRVLDSLQNPNFTGTRALYLQLIFMKKSLAVNYEQEAQFSQLINWLYNHQELNRDEQIAIFKQINQVPMQRLYQTGKYLNNYLINQELDNLACILSLEQYILLKSGYYERINPSPEISLDSVCLCASAVTETGFIDHDNRNIQADSYVASLLSWLYLHVNNINIAEDCVNSFVKLSRYFYKSLREFLPHVPEENINFSRKCYIMPHLYIPSSNNSRNPQNFRLERVNHADYLRQ